MKEKFDTSLHAMVLSEDGSYTAYSKEYNEHYHSTKDGALHESLSKHVIPAMQLKACQDEIVILDICFGLGFNTLATLYYHRQNNMHSKLKIFSPELDATLVRSLEKFIYPKEFEPFLDVIKTLSKTGVYKDEFWHVEVFLGDAREYIKSFEPAMFDVVYQDAFSPSTNPVLWTREYFADIAAIMKKEGILTTYSVALATRLALHENGFFIYLYQPQNARKSTLASLRPLDALERVDMEHKIRCNPQARSLRD